MGGESAINYGSHYTVNIDDQGVMKYKYNLTKWDSSMDCLDNKFDALFWLRVLKAQRDVYVFKRK